MPRIEDIEKLKSRINSLSNESSLLEEIGEKIEDVSPPESALDEDLNELLGSAFSPDEDTGSDEASPAETVDAAADFDAAFNFGSDNAGPGAEDSPSEDDFFNEDINVLSEGLLDESPADLSETDNLGGEVESPAETDMDMLDVFGGMDNLDLDNLGLDSGDSDISGTEEPDQTDTAPSSEGEMDLDDLFGGMDDLGLESPESASHDAGPGETEDFGMMPDEGPGSAEDFDMPADEGSGDIEDFADMPEDLAGEDLEEAEDIEEMAEVDEAEEAEEAVGLTGPESDNAAIDDLLGGEENPFSDFDGGDFSSDSDPFADFDMDDLGTGEGPGDAAMDVEFGAEGSQADESAALAELENTDDIFPESGAGGEFPEGPADELPDDMTDTVSDAEAGEEPVAAAGRDEVSLFDDTAGSEDEFIFDSVGGFNGPPPEDTGTASLDGADFPEGFGSESDSMEEYDDVDSFDLGDLGEGFGFGGEEPQLKTEEDGFDLKADRRVEPSVSEISEKDFEKIQNTLNRQPRNLKIAIEELVGSSDFAGAPLRNLLKALIDGRSTKELADIAGKITGKKIRIPVQYEKMTGEEFEAARGTFAWRFRHNVLPVMVQSLVIFLIVGMLGILAYGYIYKPIKAAGLYRNGLEEIGNGRYASGNDYFKDAFEIWPSKKQFYNYAEGFTEQKQYGLAEEKYIQLLNHFGYQKKAHYDYAMLESEILANYQSAEKQLRYILEHDMRDPDAKLAMGDNYMRWASIKPEMYEKARQQYAEYRQIYGDRFEVSFRFLRYFIETDKLEDVVNFKKMYQELRPDDKIDPQVYAEMAGYLMDKNIYDGISDVLARARDTDEYVPEIHYQYARYFRTMNKKTDEKKALDLTVAALGYRPRLTNREIAIQIDTFNRIGENLYQDGETRTAQRFFEDAEKLYQAALATRAVKPEAKFGKIYSNLGDVQYFDHLEYDAALRYYNQAEENGYSSRKMDYKQGYIYYSEEDYDSALEEFYHAEDIHAKKNNLLYALANTLFLRNTNSAALGYYLELKDRLEEELASIPEQFLLVYERSDHQSLVRNLMKVHNNIGVAYYAMYLKNGNTTNKTEAMYYFTQSMIYHDRLSRNPDTLVRGDPYSNIAVLNSDILFKVEEGKLFIDKRLVKELDGLAIQ
ncbi:MAG: hypothetical protein JW874_08910 [Spirochaetales bacterium]|nr:hypothetical protein [Spirochaetales bacterium]